MKRIQFKNLCVALALTIGVSAFAQDVIVVDQGLGTLEAAIAANGGNKIYQLKAGSWYGLTSIVEVSDSTLGGLDMSLTIIGEETDGMPAIIQVGNAADGSVFDALFQTFSDLTLKNLFLTAQDFAGVTGKGILTINAPVKVVMDNCIIDPAGVNRTFGGGDQADSSSFFLTNCQIFNNGHMLGANDGGWLGGMAWDTLWVENNTFVSSGQDFIGTPFHSVPNNSFIWINHNTFLWHDVWIKKSYNDQNFFFTNNILHDISIFAQQYFWGQFFPDYKQGNTLLSLTCIDTLEIDGGYETLPSERKVFWEYNNQYTSPGLRALPTYSVDHQGELDGKVQPLYLIPMLWNEDVPDYFTGGLQVVSPADSSRENRILADDTNWPYMKYDNNTYDVDPMYNNEKIGWVNDSLGLHIIDMYRGWLWKDSTATPTQDLPAYFYKPDEWAGTANAEFPLVWPRFDGSYTNPAMLNASIEGLPLGDLNWFPAEKAKWMVERDQIEAHILALNEDKYQMTVGTERISQSSHFAVYPNPAKNILQLSSDAEMNSVKFYDLTGKLVQQMELNGVLNQDINISNLKNGIYLLEAKTVSGETFTSKVVKQ